MNPESRGFVPKQDAVNDNDKISPKDDSYQPTEAQLDAFMESAFGDGPIKESAKVEKKVDGGEYQPTEAQLDAFIENALTPDPEIVEENKKRLAMEKSQRNTADLAKNFASEISSTLRSANEGIDQAEKFAEFQARFMESAKNSSLGDNPAEVKSALQKALQERSKLYSELGNDQLSDRLEAWSNSLDLEERQDEVANDNSIEEDFKKAA